MLECSLRGVANDSGASSDSLETGSALQKTSSDMAPQHGAFIKFANRSIGFREGGPKNPYLGPTIKLIGLPASGSRKISRRSQLLWMLSRGSCFGLYSPCEMFLLTHVLRQRAALARAVPENLATCL